MMYGPEAFCLMSNEHKLIYRSRDEQGKWRLSGPQMPAGNQLFDLIRDPGEQHNRATTEEVPPVLEGQLEDYMRSAPRFIPSQPVHVSGEDMRRQLESLGYVQ